MKTCDNNKKNDLIEKKFAAGLNGIYESLLMHVEKCVDCKDKRTCYDRPEMEILVPEKIIVMGLLAPWLQYVGKTLGEQLMKKFKLTPNEFQIFSQGRIPATVDKPIVEKLN